MELVKEKSLELLGKSRDELKAYCEGLGEPAYRADQIYHWLYAEREFSVERWSNLPAALRKKLKQETTITLPIVQQRYVSSDGSVRYLFGLGDRRDDSTTENTEDTENKRNKRLERPLKKPAAVEAVFMPSEGRQTICISTQAGCAVDCQFCLTAQLGLIRNLTAGEIVAQVLLPLKEMDEGENARQGETGKKAPASESGRYIAEEESSGLAARTNVVLMGQGEPLLNFENVMGALRILLDAEGVGLSPKHVTLSTSGIVPGIERLGKEEVRPKLAISLNASCDEQRDVLMPINKKYPLKVLMEACRNYPLRNWEHLTFEYVMLGGVNDAAEDARRVVRLLAPLTRVKVNLIPWNPGELPYKESSAEAIEEFRRILTEKGVPAFVRYSRGRDVMAACGQLALKEVQGAGAALTVLS
jgi:23S rRNA (adenine2503-C2)-methyltransferase